MWFRLTRIHRMPLVLAAFLSSLFLWIAEGVGTRSGTWLYAGQAEADPVSFAKIGSWYLPLCQLRHGDDRGAACGARGRARPQPR